MGRLRDLLNQANETSSRRNETDMFDELEDSIQSLATSTVPMQSDSLTKDGQSLEIGDPVTGIHQGYNMSGEVIGLDGDRAIVRWRDNTQSKVKINTLTMTDVDAADEQEELYLESYEPVPNMGFDKESFNEDIDLESLLKGDSNSSSRYNFNGDL